MVTNLDIHAVTSSDLRSLLAEFHLDLKLAAGELTCPDTGETITWQNIGAIRVENGQPILYSTDATMILGRFLEAS